MGLRNLDSQTLGQVASLGQRGDHIAALITSMLDGVYFADLTAGVEAANVIKVAGALKDLDGTPLAGVKDILVTSIPVSGAGTMTDGGKGVVKAGSGSKSLWMQTDVNGEFEIDVLNAVAEQNLLKVELSDGEDTLLVLTFA